MVREKIKGTGPLRGQKLVKNPASPPTGCSRRTFDGIPANTAFKPVHSTAFTGHEFQSPATTSSLSSSASSTLFGAGLGGISATGRFDSMSSLCGDQSARTNTAQNSLSFSPPALVMEHPQVRADTRIVSGSMESTIAHQPGSPVGAGNNEVYIQNGQASGLVAPSWTDYHHGAPVHQSDEQDCRYSILRSLQEQLLMLNNERENLTMSIRTSGNHMTTGGSDHDAGEDWFASLEASFDNPHPLPSTISICPSSADSSTASYHPHYYHNTDQDLLMTGGDLFEPTPLDWRARGSVVMQPYACLFLSPT